MAVLVKNQRPLWGRNLYPHGYHFEQQRLRLLRRVRYQCLCGEIAVIAHHVNGDKHDHRLSNLKACCYKCHAGLHRHTRIKRGRYVHWKRLYGRTLTSLAKEIGASQNTLSHWIKYFRWTPNQPIPSRSVKFSRFASLFFLLSLFFCLPSVAYATPRCGLASWFHLETCPSNPDPRCPTASGQSLYALLNRPYMAAWVGEFGSQWRVCSTNTPQRCAVAEVWDRGPAKRLHRIADLSPSVFQRVCGDLRHGLCEIEMTALK